MTAILFLLGFCGGVLLAFLRHPMYGLCLYVAVFYLNPQSRWWGESLPDARWALLAAVVTIAACLRLPRDPDRPSWISQTAIKFLIVWTIWIWIQIPWALVPEDHWYLATLFAKFLIVSYLVYRIVDTPERVTVFLLTHVAGCLYLAWVAHSSTYAGRLDGVGGAGIDDSNSLAMQMATGVVVGAAIILRERGWRQWLCIAAMPFILNTMMMANSRGAFLALFAGGITFWLLKPQVNRVLFYGLAGVAGALFLVVASEQFWSRFETIKAVADDSQEVESSAQSRIVLAKAQLIMASQYPLGAGHRGTAALSPKFLDRQWLTGDVNPERSSHNTFLTALVEQGIPGAVLFVWLWLWSAGAVVRLRWSRAVTKSDELQSQTAAVGAALVVIFVAGNFADFVRAEVYIWFLALLTVLIQIAQQLDKNGGPREQVRSTPHTKDPGRTTIRALGNNSRSVMRGRR